MLYVFRSGRKEREKEKPDASKVRVKERQLLVDLFKNKA